MLHVPCKHCGQPVEVDDLLAAAGQKCPRCGRPLMGDEAPPPEPAAVQGMVKAYDWYIALTGQRVAFTRAEADKLPMLCMRCGQPAVRRVEHVYWLPDNSASQYQYLADWLEAGTYQQGQRPWIRIPVPLCSAHEHEFWWIRLHALMLVIGIGAFAVLATFVTSRQVFNFNRSYSQFGLPFLPPELEMGLSAVMLVLALYSLVRIVRRLFVSGFYQNYVEMRNVSPLFSAALAEQRRQDPGPVP